MRLLVLYRPKSEHSRMTEDFIKNYQRVNPQDSLEIIDVDSREGIATLSLYDVTDYPAILVLSSDGSAQNIWQGIQLPLIDEVAGYSRN